MKVYKYLLIIFCLNIIGCLSYSNKDYMRIQYFYENHRIAITEIYAILLDNFPDYKINLIDFSSFATYPEEIPITFPEEIQKRIEIPSISIPPVNVDIPIQQIFNECFFVSMSSDDYIVIIQYLKSSENIIVSYEEFSEGIYLSYLTLSYYIKNDKRNELNNFMDNIKSCLMNNFSDRLKEEYFMEYVQPVK